VLFISVISVLTLQGGTKSILRHKYQTSNKLFASCESNMAYSNDVLTWSPFDY